MIIDFLLAGDTLVTWRMGRGALTTTREIVSARAIASARERLVRSAESGTMDRRASIALYDLLLRKHRSAFRGARDVAIVADDELSGIPFAALYDSSGGGAYVVEQTAVQVVPRLAAAASGVPAPAIVRALFVSDPTFDRASFPGLPPLPGARSEVDASRRFYLAPVVLAGASATASAVSASMMKADLVHFASHARFDPERPEQSRLVLAPDAWEREGLTARAISGMRLGGVRLAVLSSCESTRSGVADAPLTLGLAKAFHDAGVPAVVGALWRVDDDATAALMTEFHRQYSRTRDPALALRDAQRALLRGGQPAWRDPAAWGAFVFTGG
jgi:CHAT domain-containing protein